MLVDLAHCFRGADRASSAASNVRAASRFDTSQPGTPARPASSGNNCGEAIPSEAITSRTTPTEQLRRRSQQPESMPQVHQRLSTPISASQSLQQPPQSSCHSTQTAALPGNSGSAYGDSYRQQTAVRQPGSCTTPTAAAVRQSDSCRTPTSPAFSSLSWAELQQQPPAGVCWASPSYCHMSVAAFPPLCLSLSLSFAVPDLKPRLATQTVLDWVEYHCCLMSHCHMSFAAIPSRLLLMA